MFEDRRWQAVLVALFLGSGLAAGARAEPPAEKRPVPPAVHRKLQEPLRYDEPAAAAEYLRQRRAPVGEKDVPVERYLTALRRMASMPRYSTATQTVLPPRSALAGEGTSSLTGASALGRWTALGPGNIAVTTLALAPGNPNVLYAGTGEGYFNGDSMRGAGIFKTVDGGAHWTHLAGSAGPDFYAVNKIVISPLRPARIYAATGTGVWRSLDSGANWGRVLDPAIVGATHSFTSYLQDAPSPSRPL